MFPKRSCAVRLLGGFLVEVDGFPVPAQAWRYRRGADLVKLLALAPGHKLHREQVMDALWPGLARDSAAANLRKAIHYARKGLGEQQAVAAQGEMVALWPSAELSVDAGRFEAAAADALATGRGIEAAARMFTGELLPEDRYAEWSEPHRARIRDRHLELLRRAQRWDEILELDRSDEEAHRAVMRSYLAANNRQAAIRQFQRLREVLRVDLGVGPDVESVALFEKAIALKGPQPSDPSERAQALIARALMHWSQRELEEAERKAEEVRTLALAHQMGRELGEASALLGLVAWARGTWPERFRQEFAEALLLGPGQAPFVLDSHLCLAEASLGAADSDSIAALARELLPLAEKAGSLPGEALMSLLIGESELFSGRLDEAREWLSRAGELYAEIGGVSGRALALVRLAEAATALGHYPEARALLTTAYRLSEQSELVAHLRVRVFAADLEASRTRARQLKVLEDAERTLRPNEMCGPCSIGFRVAATIACARSGELARSRRCLTDAERLAGMWQGGPWQAAVWEARASVRRAEGDSKQAAALLREAAELFGESGRPLDRARCESAMLLQID
ncbi:MAG TPA: tetratricopeptide repeat protein [Candidatus Dormibacteraeota bacterium]|nr:tetratricopeptide repeat protein [Candidatus Dormibacteraeota bacterium]